MTNTKLETTAAEQTIEQLQERYRDLHTKKIQADTNLENAKATLEELKEEARRSFGTDDIEQLREKLRAMKAENEEKRRNYQAELDRIEADLASVEKNLGEADDAEGNAKEES
jgi:hypothetical protein